MRLVFVIFILLGFGLSLVIFALNPFTTRD